MDIELKRAYDKASLADGTRVLVDRLWPRGLNKKAARIHAWMRDLAPSPALRRWFHAHALQWPAFRKRYLKELNSAKASAALDQLYHLADDRKRVTLVFASKDQEHNNAVVLKELMEGMRKPPSTSGPAGAAAMPARARMRARR